MPDGIFGELAKELNEDDETLRGWGGGWKPSPEKRFPFLEGVVGWLEAFAKETPFHPQYWKAPEERAELNQLQFLEDYARMQGIPEPRAWAEDTFATQGMGEVTIGAYEPERDVVRLPTIPSGVGEEFTPGERAVGEWGIPAAVLGFGGAPTAIAGWRAAGQLPKPAMIAARTALAPLAGAEVVAGGALKYGLIIPVTKGIPAAGTRLLQTALDSGLDTWIAKYARGVSQTKGKEFASEAVLRITAWIQGNRNWFIEKATSNMLRRQAEAKGKKVAAQKVASMAADDTIKEAEPLLLKELKVGKF